MLKHENKLKKKKKKHRNSLIFIKHQINLFNDYLYY